VHGERQRVLELAGDRQAGAGDDRSRRASVQALQVPDLGGVLALAGASRRHVCLQWHLDDHRLAHPPHLGQQRRRVGYVLEHVREDSQIVRCIVLWQMQAVVAGDHVDLRAFAGDRHRRVADLDARQAPAKAAAVKL
jgi:hypothetical protein